MPPKSSKEDKAQVPPTPSTDEAAASGPAEVTGPSFPLIAEITNTSSIPLVEPESGKWLKPSVPESVEISDADRLTRLEDALKSLAQSKGIDSSKLVIKLVQP